MHDSGGDRLISPDGYAGRLSFSRDGRQLYYLLRRAATGAGRELWVTDLRSNKSASLVKGYDVVGYNVSPDGSEVVFTALRADGPPQTWLAPCDGRSAPRLLASAAGDSPAFGPDHDVVFAEVPSTAIVAVSLKDGSTRRVCAAQCLAQWSPDGTRFYVAPLLQGQQSGKTVVIPVPAGGGLPELPPAGVRSAADAPALRGSTVIDLSSFDPVHQGLTVAPGPTPESFAYTKALSHRNLFRIRLP
jgi:Tol biopolymer transport system component